MPAYSVRMTVETTGHVEAPPAWVPSDQTFGARLALVRQRMGWGNVKKAAEECGLPVQSWRTWERDGVAPNRLVTIAMAISQRTGCDYLWLVHGPDRGGARPTTRYAGGARVIAQIEREPTDRHRPDIHRSLSTRSVSQTRPMRSTSHRPEVPLAV